MGVIKFPKKIVSKDGHYQLKFEDIEPILLQRLSQTDPKGFWVLEDSFYFFPGTKELNTKHMDWNSWGGLLCICGYHEDTGEIKFFNLGIMMPELEIFKDNGAKGCGYAVFDSNSEGDDDD